MADRKFCFFSYGSYYYQIGALRSIFNVSSLDAVDLLLSSGLTVSNPPLTKVDYRAQMHMSTSTSSGQMLRTGLVVDKSLRNGRKY